MRYSRFALVLVLAAGACQEAGPVEIPVFEVTAAASVQPGGGRLTPVTKLTGAEEVPARATLAGGVSIMKLTGDSLFYTLSVKNITNVVQAHIHIGAPGTNGPIGVFLYGLVPAGGGPVNGVIATGVLTPANFIGPLAGATMADLREHILNNNAYVNVHTNDGVAPTNTGPGDFPGGEVRGALHP